MERAVEGRPSTATLLEYNLTERSIRWRTKRRRFTPEFKAEVVLEALCGESSQAELCRHHNLSEDQLSKWKQQVVENVASLFVSTDKHSSEATERIAHLELIGNDSELAGYKRIKAELGHLFSYLPERSRFNRRRRNLCYASETLRSALRKYLPTPEVFIVDSFPIALCDFKRAKFLTSPLKCADATGTLATYSKTRTKGLGAFLEFQVSLISTLYGLPVDFAIAEVIRDFQIQFSLTMDISLLIKKHPGCNASRHSLTFPHFHKLRKSHEENVPESIASNILLRLPEIYASHHGCSKLPSAKTCLRN